MGEFSFPRLVVFCLLPVTYKRGQRPFVSSPPDAASNSWRPRLDVHFSVSFLFFLSAKREEEKKEENPTALHSSACWLSSEKTQRCYTFIPFLSFPSSNTLIKGKEANGRKGMLLGEGTALTSN